VTSLAVKNRQFRTFL